VYRSYIQDRASSGSVAFPDPVTILRLCWFAAYRCMVTKDCSSECPQDGFATILVRTRASCDDYRSC
jgi:hypothetical protein